MHMDSRNSATSFHAIGTGSGILGYRPCWCQSPLFLRLPYLGAFYSLFSSSAIGFHSCFFFTSDISAPFTYSAFTYSFLMRVSRLVAQMLCHYELTFLQN